MRFFEKRAKYPRFKSYYGKQSCQYPQNVKIVDGCLKIPQLGLVKASIHRIFSGKIKVQPSFSLNVPTVDGIKSIYS